MLFYVAKIDAVTMPKTEIKWVCAFFPLYDYDDVPISVDAPDNDASASEMKIGLQIRPVHGR